MKKIFLLLNLCVINYIFSQQPKIKTDLPEIIPPSPTVANLMRFEEIPVSNYTGVPDVTIPLFQIPTHSQDLNINISLNYHPSNVKADNIASDVGLGWSMIAGGTISRTVRGLPDEQLVLDGPDPGKVGLYHTSLQNHKNYYYKHISNLSAFAYQNPYEANKYYWDITESQKYDTEHDLWQFNFMGSSGRFYIKKNSNNFLEVVPLSDYRIKIVNHYITANNNDYVPSGFTIYDEKGYKYLFEVFETTRNSQALENIHPLTPSTSLTAEKEFRSAFHLTKIYDNNNNLLVNLEYNTAEYVENNTDNKITENIYEPNGVYEIAKRLNCFYEFKPMKQYVNSFSRISVKKVQAISITDVGRIEFDYSIGRQDSNMLLASQAVSLHSIVSKDWNNNIIKSYQLGYDYSTVLKKRLILKSIKEKLKNNILGQQYDFSYKKSNPSNLNNISIDYWGYFNSFGDNCQNQDTSFMREPSPLVSTLDLLQKIKYPTGGSSVFAFESNQYSFIGDKEVTDFSENPLNEQFIGSTTLFFNNATPQYLPIYHKDRKVTFKPSIVQPEDQNIWSQTFSLYKIENGQNIPINSLYCTSQNSNCCIDLILDKNTQYAIRRDNFDLNYTNTDQLYIEYRTAADVENKFLYGGGNRIAKIGYFDQDVPQDYYDNMNTAFTPKKEKVYTYNWPDGTGKSSGVLAYIKPVFVYNRSTKIATMCPESPFNYITEFRGTVNFVSKTNFNNTPLVHTQGSEVGYKYVNFYESGKGVTKQQYTSPIDYPEELSIANTKPFIPSKNIDYKRGLLLKETIWDTNNKELVENTFNYDFVDFEENYGYRFDKPDGVGFDGSHYTSYDLYQSDLINQQGPIFCSGCAFNSFSSSNLSGYPVNYIQAYKLTEAYGWAKLSNKTTKNYFYQNGVQKTVKRQESFEYNPVNKKIALHTINTEDGDVLKTQYSYHTGNSSFSQNRVSEIEKIENYKNNTLIDSKKIVYDNNWDNNVSFLPKEIQSAFAASSLEKEVTYDKYDSKGNLQQYTAKDGISTVIIWGYNQTQPIAKIEGAKLSDIQQSLIDSIVNASNTDAVAAANNDETLLLSVFNTFRNSLLNYQITTYTYDPLIGVRSITSSSGIRENYIYDSAGRLEKVIDMDGKVLKEFKYNYKQ